MMPTYLFKTHGVRRADHILGKVEETFEAADDATAIAHVEAVLVQQAEQALFAIENAELHSGTVPVGILDMRRKTWQMGDVPHDERPIYGGYTRTQLQAGFNLVRSPDHWKEAIDTVVPKDADLELIGAAVAFFNGSELETEEVEAGYRVRAASYYESIGS